MQLLSFRPEWRNLLLLFLSDSSVARQQREMSSSDGDKQVCLLQGVAVFNRQLNKRRSRKRCSLAYYSSYAFKSLGKFEPLLITASIDCRHAVRGCIPPLLLA